MLASINIGVQAQVYLGKKVGSTWIKIPCIANIGSCTYDDLCELLAGITCPDPFVSAGVPCQCPFRKVRLHYPKIVVHSGLWDSHDSPKRVLSPGLWVSPHSAKIVLHSDLWVSPHSPKIVLSSALWVSPHSTKIVLHSDLWDSHDSPKIVLHSDLWDSQDSPKIVLPSDL